MATGGILFRLLAVAGLLSLLLVVYAAATRLVLARARRASPGLPQFARGTPGVVFFTTVDCVTCKAAQRPALQTLERRLADGVQVITVDALDSAEIAKKWSVLSVPTTFVLDRDGRPRHVNHGFASADKLFAQIASLGQI